MRRAGRVMGKKDLSGKIAGVVLAICGIVIIFVQMPSVFWWFLLGAVLILLGWKLFTY